MFNEKKFLAFSANDFLLFSGFLTIIGLIFIVIHIVLMQFYSSSYRHSRCERVLDEILDEGRETLKERFLESIRKNLIPQTKGEFSFSKEQFNAVFEGVLEKVSFRPVEDHSDTFAAQTYGYRLTSNATSQGYCGRYFKNFVSTSRFKIVQIPLSSWLIYNSGKNTLRFSSYVSARYPGRVHSESDIVFNYRSGNFQDKRALLSWRFEENPYTLFINYDDAGNDVGGGLTSHGIIETEIHERVNNLIYLKRLSEYRSFDSLYELKPIRLISDVRSPVEAKGFDRMVSVKVPPSGLHVPYHNVDYLRWIYWIESLAGDKKVKISESITKNDVLLITVSGGGLKITHIDSLSKIRREVMKQPEWLRDGKKMLINFSGFFTWYNEKFNIPIPIIERKVHRDKGLLCYFKSDKPGVSFVLTNADDIAFRSFFIFSGDVAIRGNLNVSREALFISANDFELIAESSGGEIILNGVFAKRNLTSVFHDFFKTGGGTDEVTFRLRGAFLILAESGGLERASGDIAQLSSFKIQWDPDFLREQYWMDFVPSKYYLRE